MIKSFAHKGLKEFYETGSDKCGTGRLNRVFKHLTLILWGVF